MVLEEGFARNIRRQVGDTVTLYSGKRPRFSRGRPAKMTGAAGFRQAGLIMMPLESAHGIGRARRLDGANRRPDAAWKPSKRAGRISRCWSRGRTATSGRSFAIGWQNACRASWVSRGDASIIVSAFIILNTFLINVSERRRQLAIMRPSGPRGSSDEDAADRRAGHGSPGHRAGDRRQSALLPDAGHRPAVSRGLAGPQFTLAPFLYAPLFGMGVSLLGSLWPAYKAST